MSYIYVNCTMFCRSLGWRMGSVSSAGSWLSRSADTTVTSRSTCTTPATRSASGPGSFVGAASAGSESPSSPSTTISCTMWSVGSSFRQADRSCFYERKKQCFETFESVIMIAPRYRIQNASFGSRSFLFNWMMLLLSVMIKVELIGVIVLTKQKIPI